MTPTEPDDVRTYSWRLESAEQLGYSWDDAHLFAESKGELEQLRRLVKAGCPLPIALLLVL